MARSRVKRISITRRGGRTRVRVTVRTTGAKSKRAARRISKRIARRMVRRILRREARRARRIVRVPTMKWRTKRVGRHISRAPRRLISNSNGDSK